MRAIHTLGHSVLQFTDYSGRLIQLIIESWAAIFMGRAKMRLVLQEIVKVGFASQTVVIITGAFSGFVLTAQSYFQLSLVNLETAVGAVLAAAMSRELGPVLTGLMLVGRVGASMTAEIGTMKVSEQIDALRSFAIHPTDHLVAPRVIALLISIPLLILESIFFGIMASWLIAVGHWEVENVYFWNQLNEHNGPSNLIHSATKGLVFGQIIVFIGCLNGLEAKDGAVGVGRSTTQTVVVASLLILVSNFFLTLLINIFLPTGFVTKG